MKKYSNIILIIIVALFSSCAKESIENGGGNDVPIVKEDSGYLSSFAQILSAAVYNEPELRDYIKVEALAEFDMDHDVMQPFISARQLTDDPFGIHFQASIKKPNVKHNYTVIAASRMNDYVKTADWKSEKHVPVIAAPEKVLFVPANVMP